MRRRPHIPPTLENFSPIVFIDVHSVWHVLPHVPAPPRQKQLEQWAVAGPELACPRSRGVQGLPCTIWRYLEYLESFPRSSRTGLSLWPSVRRVQLASARSSMLNTGTASWTAGWSYLGAIRTRHPWEPIHFILHILRL